MIVELVFLDRDRPLHPRPFESSSDLLPIPNPDDRVKFGDDTYTVIGRSFRYVEPEEDAPIRTPSVRVTVECRLTKDPDPDKRKPGFAPDDR